MMITAHGAAAALALLTYARVTRRRDLAAVRVVATMFLFGTLPDLPLSFLVLTGLFDPAIHYHHTWITHTPIFWAVVAALTMNFVSRRTGLMLLGSTWLHLAMDWYGGADGIAFLYPLDRHLYGARLSGVNGPAGFFQYIHQPLFLGLELLVQGTFLIIVLRYLYEHLNRNSSNSTKSSSA